MNANDRIDLLVVAGNKLAALTRREMFLNIGKAEAKSAAIRRIMQTENEETKKPHSASSAEKIVEVDTEYREYLTTLSETVFDKIEAQAAYDAAKLTALLTVNLESAA